MEVDEKPEAKKEAIIERVIDLLNDAITCTKDTEKVKLLLTVQELVIHHDLLDNFLDEVLGFQNDRLVEVRKFVVGFIEASCKSDPDFFSKLIINLNFSIGDENANVVKRAIQATTQLYKAFLKWIIKSKTDDIIESTWDVWEQIKQQICTLLDTTENEGVRTQCVKFMEMLVIVETRKDQWSTVVPSDDLNLEDLNQCKLVDVGTLEDEAKTIFEQLIIFHGTPHISSVNLMATMQSLVLIARCRSKLFMSKVISALEALHANLPPTLAKSQVSSVRKFLKLQLLILLKHPMTASVREHNAQVINLLTDLGATQSEINRCIQEVRKRGLKVDQPQVQPKRIKLEADETKPTSEPQVAIPKITKNEANTAIDITAQDLIPPLSRVQNVADLVLVSLLSLPDVMPAHFQSTYTPVSAAGNETQIRHLSRLMATQFTAIGIGKGVSEMIMRLSAASSQSTTNEEQQQKIATVVSRGIAQEVKRLEHQQHPKTATPSKVKLIPTGKVPTTTTRAKQFHLNEVTKPLSEETKGKLVLGAVDRILRVTETRSCLSESQINVRNNILTHLSSEFKTNGYSRVSEKVKEHVFEDLKNRHELLFKMLYNEFFQGKQANDLSHYTMSLVSLISDIIINADDKDREHFLPKFYCEAPLIPREAVERLSAFITSSSPGCVAEGFIILRNLIEKRKALRPDVTRVLTGLCLHAQSEIRIQAVKTCKYLYDSFPDLKETIEQFASATLKLLLESSPPSELSRTPEAKWDDESMKMCLMPMLSLLSSNNKLIHELSDVYVNTNADIKRVILRGLEGPVKGMGMNSPELLLFVENCPKGAETLVTRVIHVLTDKQSPSTELVSRVRDLYHKRVPDVRFLIPVLNGLSKREVIAELHKLIKLNPVVVKEVFNKLLGVNAPDTNTTSFQIPLTPTELLIALHNIKPSDCDVKTVIKATSLCFAEKSIYTAEVLSVVMQQLVDQNPLPTLLMRTVIQSLSLYPVLIGNVMGILHKLSLKKVWTDKKIWEGFIKCCQKTKPRSFQVLLQLPPPQLQTVFDSSSDFKLALQEHINSLNDVQRAHVPHSLLEVIFSDNEPTPVATDEPRPSHEELDQNAD
ncbi:Symplekin [Halotydeus destructor]|nr:Symplekin [Halotydeus destructor]